MMKKQILSNLTSNYALSFVGMVLGFLLVPFLIHKLGKDVYGLIVLTESTIAFFEILTVSVRMALSRYATFALSQDKMDEFIEYLSTGFRILYFSAAAVLTIGVLLSYNFPSIFKVPAQYEFESKVHFFLIALAFTLSIPNIIYWSVLYAKQRFDLINFSTSFGLIMRAVCIFAFYSLAPKKYICLMAYGFIYLIMTLTQNYMIYFWHKKVIPGVKISMRKFNPAKVREILSFSVHTSLTRGSQLLYENTANIIINVLWGPSYNAIYSVGLKLPNMMKRIFVEPTWALTPTFTDLAAKNDRPRIQLMLYMFSKLLAIITLPILFSLVFFSRQIINLWVGPEFSMASDLLYFYTIPLFFGIPFAFTGCLFNAYAKVKVPSLTSVFTSTLNVVLCLVFGYSFSMKLYGIAMASVVSASATGLGFFPYYACRISGLSLGRYWKESIIKPIGLGCAIMIPGFFIFKSTQTEIHINLLLAVVYMALSFIYYLTSYLFLLTAEEKSHVNEVIRSVTVKLKKSDNTASGAL